MAYLILHVGPGKCGSSSIQNFFRTNPKAVFERVVFNFFDHRDIAKLNIENPPESAIKNLSNYFEKNKNTCDVIILSHEYFFDCPLAVKNICDLGKSFFQKTIVIGYSRKQSDFVVSVYSQWLFRHKNRFNETQKILLSNDIEPLLFNALERHLIASIFSDFYTARQPSNREIMDWYESYEHLLDLIKQSKTSLRCGLLPNKFYNQPLLKDFCEKAGLKLKKDDLIKKDTIRNVKFSPDLLEAMNNALMFEMEVPHPDMSNDFINKVSQKITKPENVNTFFLDNMKNYIDSYFFPSNKMFCEKYNLMQEYFSPEELVSKHEILNTIKNEQKKRFSNSLKIIEENKKVSAKMALACLDLSQEINKTPIPKVGRYINKVFRKK